MTKALHENDMISSVCISFEESNRKKAKQVIPRAETLPIQAKTPTDSKPTAHAAVGRGQQRKRQAARAPRQQHESAGRRSSRPMTAYLKATLRHGLDPHASAINSVVQTQTLCYSCAPARGAHAALHWAGNRCMGLCSTNARLGNKKTHWMGGTRESGPNNA
jgi:hypothetical protein